MCIEYDFFEDVGMQFWKSIETAELGAAQESPSSNHIWIKTLHGNCTAKSRFIYAYAYPILSHPYPYPYPIPNPSICLLPSHQTLLMVNMRNRAILLQVNIQSIIISIYSQYPSRTVSLYLPVWSKVASNHRTRFNNSRVLWQVCLCKRLQRRISQRTMLDEERETYNFIMHITELLAHELVLPFGGLVSAGVGGYWIDERHVG